MICQRYHPKLGSAVFWDTSVVHLLLCCWQNDRCLTDGKRATSARSFLPNRNVQASVHSGTGIGSAVRGAKSLQQPVCCTAAVNSVTTTTAVNAQLPTPAVKPQQPVVTPSTCTSTPATHHTGELLGVLKLSMTAKHHCISRACKKRRH